MMRLIVVILGGLFAATAAQARPPAPSLSPSMQCEAAISATEARLGIPDGLLQAIGMVESGRADASLHRAAPWPWIIDVGGEDHVYASKADAVAATQALLAQGVKSIDVGCVQVNLMYHPDAFPTLDAAFDPATNVAYGGRFLRDLFRLFGSWDGAAGAYHSQTPEIAGPYRDAVMALWRGSPLPLPPPAPAWNTNADVYGSWPPKNAQFAAMPPANFAFRCCRTATMGGH